MYLKRLDIVGFKSFAGKTSFDFERGMTAVVGPNGCGKSNVSDAIRWVLGEQSAKQLRGSNMQDVIFNGTEEKKPLGFAEVSLTLADTDTVLPLEYNEVSIARRVYRTGESEYYINKTPCRLKDIHELFRGTGVGSNPYSMVAQGNIDLILSSKPEERRFVFEEAAGITKFKSQKKESLRKLEQTQANLLRVTDIMSEVKKQIGSIQRQANKAQRYKQFLDELKESELQCFARQYTQLTQKLHSQGEEKKQIQEVKTVVQAEIDQLESEIVRLREELESFNQHLAQKNAEKHIMQSDGNRLEEQIAFQNQQIEESTQKVAKLAEDIQFIDGKLKHFAEQVGSREEDFSKISQESSQMLETISQKESELTQVLEEIDRVQKILLEQKTQMVGMASHESQVKNDLFLLQAEEKSLYQEKKRLETEIEENRAWKQKQEQELEGLSQHLVQEETSLRELENHLEKVRENFSQMRFWLDGMDREVTKQGTVLSEKRSKLELLQDLKKRFEGYYVGVRSVMQASQEGHLRGICGVVAELLHVPREYEMAIEVALGGRIQHLVTETAEDAKRAIQFLKQHNCGQATFLPLDLFQGGESLSFKEKHSGILGNALDFVTFDSKYGKIFKSILGNTLLAQDLDSALSVAKKPHMRCQLVTLEGDAVNSRGAITGGSNKNKVRGFISRDGQIEELLKSVEELTNELNQTVIKRDETRLKRDAFEKELHDLQIELHKNRVAVATKQNECSKIKAAIHGHTENAALFREELAKINELILVNQQRQQELTSQVDSTTQLNSDLQSNLSSVEKELLLFTERKGEVTEEITRLKIALAQVQEKEKGLASERLHLEQAITDHNRTLQQRRNEMEEVVRNAEQAAALLLKLKEEQEVLQEKQTFFGSELEGIVGQRQEMLTHIQLRELNLAQTRGRVNHLQERSHALEIQEAQEKVMLDNLMDKAAEEYHTDLSGIVVDENLAEADWKAKENRIQELRRKIESMGPVNLIAIEELNELQERDAFLEKQNSDLVQAKEHLEQVISKINVTMREMFETTFEQIRVNFQETFTKLFNGGKADILLSDEHPDILETGIEIIARPPGKKLTSISLMSGGERALTAVGLLFALFKVKPSPFCVLDEIDAPLDESNINRFVEMVKEFLSDSQFIVITHNKRTISASDLIYGVTMEESGVSKVVSVKFGKREALDEHEEKYSYGFAGK